MRQNLNNLIRDYFENYSIDLKYFDILNEKYSEPHRHYHNWNHINDMLVKLTAYYHKKDILCMPLHMLLAVLYHDAIYIPGQNDNEQKSIELFEEHAAELHLRGKTIAKVVELIEATKYVNIFQSIQKAASDDNMHEDVKIFLETDLDSFSKNAYGMWQDSLSVFKEYQFIDFSIFKEGRIKILKKLKEQVKHSLSANIYEGLVNVITLTEAWQPNIAVYPGTFNPFHKGHLNILQKAEKIFDKVIIAYGSNPDKEKVVAKTPKELQYHQIDSIHNSLIDYVATKSYPVTIIRGIRNITDMQMELNQYRINQELSDNKLNMVSIFCDKEFEHISSSALRQLENISSEKTKELYEKYRIT